MLLSIKASLTENHRLSADEFLAKELRTQCAYEASTFYKIQKLHNKDVGTKIFMYKSNFKCR